MNRNMSPLASFTLVLCALALASPGAAGTAVSASPTASTEECAPQTTMRRPTVAVTLSAGALNVSTQCAPAGPTEFVIRNQSGEGKSFVLGRHVGPLPHFFDLALVRFVPSREIVERVGIPRGRQRRLQVALPAGRYVLVESEPLEFQGRIVADAVKRLTTARLPNR